MTKDKRMPGGRTRVLEGVRRRPQNVRKRTATIGLLGCETGSTVLTWSGPGSTPHRRSALYGH
jgi:hypothetical protein